MCICTFYNVYIVEAEKISPINALERHLIFKSTFRQPTTFSRGLVPLKCREESRKLKERDQFTARESCHFFSLFLSAQ